MNQEQRQSLMNLSSPFLSPLTILTLTVVASSSAASDATPNRVRFGEAWQTVACTTFDVPATVASQSDCGYVTVPERHGQPQGRTIQLAVVRTRSSSKAPADDPLFVLQGGPGDSGIGVFVNQILPLFPELKALLKSRDLIFMEERGTRYSKPFLSCPEINAHNIAVAQGQRAYTDVDWLKACNDRFKKQEINLNAFNTRENAADVFSVAETLSYKQFNFYGVSYGALLGQYVIAQADRHMAKLRSVILDGVIRPDIDFNLAAGHTISYALRNVFHACAQDRLCSQAYPNLESKLLAIVDRLNQKPVPITLIIPSSKTTIAAKLDGNAFISGMVHYLYRPYSGETSRGSSLPRFIQAASQDNFGWIAEKLSEDLESNDSAKEMYHTVLCARAKSFQVTPSQVLPTPYPQLLSFGIREAEVGRKVCAILQVELKPPFVIDNPEIPILVLNGAYDPVTPEPYGEAVAKHMKTAYVYTFPGVGHGVLMVPLHMPAGACATQIAADFLRYPRQAPDSQCLNRIKPAFVIE
ncbi:MAG: alpha/beta hydrolase [Prochlorococcaceae cyanobacterium]